MKLYLGSDHRGFDLKQQLLSFLQQFGHEVIDLGAHELVPEDDFNEYAVAVSRAVLAEPDSFGILLCGSAHGVAIQANRFRGIRAICGFTPVLAERGREHNDANILCVDADFVAPDEAKTILDTFVNTRFLALDRYIRRNEKLDGEL
jgi:ribose 5-phosphate isomerase B